MGTITVSEFTTLDGSIGAPTFTVDYPFTDAMAESMARLTGGAKAILFGRTTWVESGPAWSSRGMADDPGAPFFNDTPKYVVSRTLDDVSTWSNSILLGGYDVGTIQRLKDSVAGGIYVYGSGTLVRALLADGLVDELHLFVYPVVTGSGPRLFPGAGAVGSVGAVGGVGGVGGVGTETGPAMTMALAENEAYANGVVHLAYTPATGPAS